jgi:hypothetical protein
VSSPSLSPPLSGSCPLPNLLPLQCSLSLFPCHWLPQMTLMLISPTWLPGTTNKYLTVCIHLPGVFFKPDKSEKCTSCQSTAPWASQ